MPKAGTHQPTNFTPAKGKSLSTFVDYFLCAGQKEVAALGYSPLPLNLVQGGLLQNSKIPGAVAGPNPTTLAGCDNPTFTNGKLTLLITAPQPSPCDKVGEPLNCIVVNGKATTPGAGSSPSPGASDGSSPAVGVSPGPAPSASSGPIAVTGQVVNVAAASPNKLMLSVLTAGAIIFAVMVPPALGGWLHRRRRQESG